MTTAPDINSGPLLYWRIIRTLHGAYGFFLSRTVVDLVGDRHRKGIERYLNFLLEERVLKVSTTLKHGASETRHYELVRDGEAPPLRRVTDGLGTRQTLLWGTMRSLRQFSAAELAIAASTDETMIPRETASGYVRNLQRAGYVVMVGEGVVPVYRLLATHNTGPRAPIILREQGACFDLNLMQTISASVNPNQIGRAA